MPEKDFEFTIICPQARSRAVLDAIDKLGISYKLEAERSFAPLTPDVALKILVTAAQLLQVLVSLFKILSKNDAYAEFETRHELAKKMLADLEPLYWIKGEDRKDYSYYEFKTAKCKHFWKLDRGAISHGPLRCS